MKKLYQIILQNRVFVIFILLFAYVHSVNTRLLIWGNVTGYVFTPDAAFGTLIDVTILYIIILFFIRRWQSSDVFSTKEIVRIFSASMLVYLFATHLFGLLIAVVFGNVQRNFNGNVFGLSTLSHLLDGCIYGSFLLAYYYYQKNNKHREKLAVYHKALSENRIRQLKTQLNPHFLFNNLNILDQLIHEDKNSATSFLHDFAEIYRYVLQASEKKLVSISEEVAFAKQYFNLIQHKYGDAYQLQIGLKETEGYMIPLTLQLLIENAIQHNMGTAEKAVIISIDTDVTSNLRISNNLTQKRKSKTSAGLALNNLREQYHLVSSSRLKVDQSDTDFTVIIPVIHSK